MGLLGMVAVVAALVIAVRTRRRLREVDAMAREHAEALQRVELQLRALEARLVGPPSIAALPDAVALPIPETPPVVVPSPAVSRPVVPPPVILPPAPVVAPPPLVPPADAPLHPAAAVPASPSAPGIAPPPAPFIPRPPVSAPPFPPAGEPADDGVASVPPGAPPPGTPRPPLGSAIDWENLVGVKLFSWVAGIALVFAAIFFLRYSIEHGWLTPPIRMAIGLATGAGLLILCELRAARRYPVTANALDAAGIAILFSTLFASHALWNLLPQVPVFLLMILVTAVAVMLSLRRDSLFIAVLGLLGGFATPALLSTGEDRPIGLFGYLLLLNAGLAWVAYRKRWRMLTTLSVAATFLYQWAWVVTFLDAARLPLAMAIFLVFPLLHLIALSLGLRGERAAADTAFEHTAAAAALLPLLFALYVSVVPAYGAHYALLFGFLLLVAVGLAAIAIQRGPASLHLYNGIAVVLTWVVWLAVSYPSAAWPGVLGFLVAFVLLFLALPEVERRLRSTATDAADTAQTAGPVLLLAVPVLAYIEPATAAPALLFTVLFGLLAATAVAALRAQAGRLHVVAAVFALAAEAVWSAKHLTPDRLLAALTIYGVFALFYLGVPLLAERRGRPLTPAGSGALVLFVSLALLFFLAAEPVAPNALWGMALLLAVLNAGLFFEASRGRLPLLALLGAVLSWAVIAVWWDTAMVTSALVPALLVVAGFAALIVAGSVWAQQHTAAAGGAAETVGQSVWLALVGHLFLLFVASRPELAVPPWPLLGVVALLDVAILAAVLYTRSAGSVHLAAVVASQVVLAVWVIVAEQPPWPLVGIVSSCAVAMFAVVSLPASRRRGIGGDTFAYAAMAGSVAAQLVTIIAAAQPVAPPLLWVLGAHVLLLLALFGVAADRGWHELAVFAVVPAMGQCALRLPALAADTWTEHLLFAAVLYALFLAYPMWLGKRAGAAREPWIGAVVASAAFFLLARQCIVTGGYGHVIGILPVIQAALLLGLLAHLRGIEPRGEPASGRVALVAGAALALITGAIPLQLEREWITIGWALESTALAWLYGRLGHRGLLAWSAALAAAVSVRLVFNPAVFAYHPRSSVPIFNWYLYTYLVTAAALFASAYLLRRTDDRFGGGLRVSNLLPAAGAVLLFVLLNIEIADFYSTGRAVTFNFSAGLAQDLTYTLGWAVFGIGLLTAGIVAGQRVPRIAALGLLVVTVVKCFMHDLWRLGGLYRVGSFVGLAVCLALVAVLMQRFVLGSQKEAT